MKIALYMQTYILVLPLCPDLSLLLYYDHHLYLPHDHRHDLHENLEKESFMSLIIFDIGFGCSLYVRN
jgi:hypothetical protein